MMPERPAIVFIRPNVVVPQLDWDDWFKQVAFSKQLRIVDRYEPEDAEAAHLVEGLLKVYEQHAAAGVIVRHYEDVRGIFEPIAQEVGFLHICAGRHHVHRLIRMGVR